MRVQAKYSTDKPTGFLRAEDRAVRTLQQRSPVLPVAVHAKS